MVWPGSSIIDMVFMVIDATKGIQTQTAEGFVLAEITTDTLVIILNKVDLLPEETRTAAVDRISAKLRKALEPTRFNGKLTIIPFAARPGGGVGVGTNDKAIGVAEVKAWLLAHAPRPLRNKMTAPFLFAVDHCFSIKGKGTVATGTVLRGRIDVNGAIEVPHLHVQKKVKSIQLFKQPVEAAKQGDRVGLLIPGLEPTAMERGLLCAPNSVSFHSHIYCSFVQVPYFKLGIKSGSKFHVTIAHTTVVATATLLRVVGDEHTIESSVEKDAAGDSRWRVLLDLEQPIAIPSDSVYVASKLDTDINANACRLAFHGAILQLFDSSADRSRLRAFKTKTKVGEMERIVDSRNCIGRNLFKRETDMNLFSGMTVQLQTYRKGTDGEEILSSAEGLIEGAFGKSGKFKISCRSEDPFSSIPPGASVRIRLFLKRYFWCISSDTAARKKYVQ